MSSTSFRSLINGVIRRRDPANGVMSREGETAEAVQGVCGREITSLKRGVNGRETICALKQAFSL
jgi:hypothetical protein